MTEKKSEVSLFFPKLFSILLFVISVMTGVLFFMAQFYAAAILIFTAAPVCVVRWANLNKKPPDLEKYDINSFIIYFLGTMAFFAAGQMLTGFLCGIVSLLKLLMIEAKA